MTIDELNGCKSKLIRAAITCTRTEKSAALVYLALLFSAGDVRCYIRNRLKAHIPKFVTLRQAIALN